MNSDGLSYKLLTSSSGGSMFSDSSSLFSNETKNHSRESSQRVIVSVDLIFASGRWRLSEESQDVLNFCLSNIVNARDCLFVVAIEVKRGKWLGTQFSITLMTQNSFFSGKFTKENSQASMTNELESILAMWIKDANERRVGTLVCFHLVITMMTIAFRDDLRSSLLQDIFSHKNGKVELMMLVKQYTRTS